MKKIITLTLIISFLSTNIGFCESLNIDKNEQNQTEQILNKDVSSEENKDNLKNTVLIDKNNIENVKKSAKKLSKKEYKRSTVFKYYTPYEITFKNTNEMPILMTTDTEVEFVKQDGSIIKSSTRRDIYMRTRKRDRGRHYALAIPGIFLGTAVSVGTFMLGTPIGYGIYRAMQYPVIKAGRTNVMISQDLYSNHGLPLRFEPGIEYPIYFYPPEKTDIKSVILKKVPLNNTICDIEIPIEEAI